MSAETNKSAKKDNLMFFGSSKQSILLYINAITVLTSLLALWQIVSNKFGIPLNSYLWLTVLVFVIINFVIYFIGLKKHNIYLEEQNIYLQESVKKLETAQNKIIKQGIVKTDTNTYLILNIDQSKGYLTYNKKRNILMNLHTIQSILAGIKEIAEHELRKTGKTVGISFAISAFRDYLKTERDSNLFSNNNVIDLWCEYDRIAGFGYMENHTIYDDREQKCEGFIMLYNSFLTDERIGEQENLCSFMEGYIEGVVNMIISDPNKKIGITHSECNGHDVMPHTGCRFDLSYDDKKGQDIVLDIENKIPHHTEVTTTGDI
jgi:hypothetical protein